MIGASAAYVSRQPWRNTGSMIAPPCRISPNKTIRKGLVFLVVALLISVSGTIMTVLGFTRFADSGSSMLGMLMVAVSVLLFLGSLRQYLKAKKMKAAERTRELPHGTVAASLVIESDETNRTLTVVMDTVAVNASYERRSTEGSLPPDYIEATTGSDMYSEIGVVVDPDGEDPPPPYGPPTYEQAISEDCCCTPHRHGDTVTSSGQSVPARAGSEGRNFMDMEGYNDTDLGREGYNNTGVGREGYNNTGVGREGYDNTGVGREGYTNTSAIGEEINVSQPVGYQDLPTVTI